MRLHQHITQTAGLLTAMLLSVALFSCDKELENSGAESAGNISFGLYEDTGTRSAAETSTDGTTVAYYTLRSDVSRDTLCVQQTVTDGIEGTPFAKSQYASRATPVKEMYDKFRVVAALRENDNIGAQFYMNETATKSGTVWSPANVYYWPGQNRQLRFLAWAPADVYLEDSPVYPTLNPQKTTISYSTPIEAVNQPDLVAASTGFIDNPGNNGTCTPVPLTFKHLCTAIILKTGSEMQPGTIKSVTITNVRKSGDYDFVQNAWTLNAETTDYTQELNRTMTGGEADGTALHEESATFMLLPQTLGENSQLQVVFHDNMTDDDRTLTASLEGSEWPMGKTVTYRLSISPEYELDFAEDNPTVADAHYTIVPVKINAKSLKGGNYTLVSSAPTVCKLRANLIGPESQGYWPKETTGGGDFKREVSVKSSTEGTATFYAFLTENTKNADRDIALQLQYNGKTIHTMTITQKCPNWQDDMGWERTEEDGTKPFGFAWTRKVTYTPKNTWNVIWVSILRLFGAIQSNPAVSFETGFLGVVKSCTIDYSKAQSLSNVFSTTDGLSNTKHFSANSASDLATIESTIAPYCNKSETGENIESTDFAALTCLKKNACNVEKQTKDGQVAYLPSFDETDINWYLPAIDQFTGASLTGQYWSSTGIEGDNANAYSWNGSLQTTPRMDFHNVRAVRKRP